MIMIILNNTALNYDYVVRNTRFVYFTILSKYIHYNET